MVYVHDRNFIGLGAIDIYKSLIWRRKYFSSGDYELHIPVKSIEDISYIRKENLIRKGSEFGIIETINLATDEVGEEYIVLKGRFISKYISKRIIWGTYNFHNKYIEEVVETLLNTQLINPSDVKRKIDKLTIKKNNLLEKLSFQVSYDNLLDTIESLCQPNDIGYKIQYSAEKDNLIFELYKGIDRSIEQNINDHCIFSKNFENILSKEYCLDISNYKNITLVAGEGEGDLRKLITVGNESLTGLDREEVFTDAKDIQKEENTDSQYNSLLISKGIEKLNEHKLIESFEASININSNLKYKEDFDLGDLVTFVDNEIGIAANKRIIEIEEIYEDNQFKINCTFGEGRITIIDKLKRMGI